MILTHWCIISTIYKKPNFIFPIKTLLFLEKVIKDIYIEFARHYLMVKIKLYREKMYDKERLLSIHGTTKRATVISCKAKQVSNV